MSDIFTEIKKIAEKQITFDTIHPNRHTILTLGMNGTKTAYCFAVPIYNEHTNNIVDMKFFHCKTFSSYEGSNSKILITDSIRMQNEYGYCDIILPGLLFKKTEDTLFWNSLQTPIEIKPTMNGLVFKVPCFALNTISITIKLGKAFPSINTNNKYFAIMREKFIPFITLSCLGTLNNRGEVMAPCEVCYQELNDKEFYLTFTTKNKVGKYISFEINMQEAKLFQDTTVESQHPKLNNAFGGTAFLGQTDTYGEQWLYSRLEFSNLLQLQNKRIIKAILHIPKLNSSNCLLKINRISTRFCSFGSNWDNKIPIAEPLTESVVSNGYYHFDITNLLSDIKKKSENYVIRAKNSNSEPAVISTGDSFFKPQILEVKFK